MDLIVALGGQVECVYGEEIDLHEIGPPRITRASHVEPDDEGRWFADLTPLTGPILGPFPQRSQALEAERQWLEDHWLKKRS